MKALVLRTDETHELIDLPTDYREIGQLVGGWLELVNVRGGFLYVNEEGKLENLTPNLKATRFCHAREAIRANDCIVGNVVLVGVLDAKGEHKDVDKALIQELLSA